MRQVIVELDDTKLQMLRGQLDKRAHLILDKAAFDIERVAKMLARVDTGAMRASVYVSGSRGSSGGTPYGSATNQAASRAKARGKSVKFNGEVKARHPYERVIAPAVGYAFYIEKNVQPFIKPAVQAAEPNLRRAWKSLFEV